MSMCLRGLCAKDPTIDRSIVVLFEVLGPNLMMKDCVYELCSGLNSLKQIF